jgi:hypothetical protein
MITITTTAMKAMSMDQTVVMAPNKRQLFAQLLRLDATIPVLVDQRKNTKNAAARWSNESSSIYL